MIFKVTFYLIADFCECSVGSIRLCKLLTVIAYPTLLNHMTHYMSLVFSCMQTCQLNIINEIDVDSETITIVDDGTGQHM